MSKLKRVSRCRTRDALQNYQPRIEAALHALANAMIGCQMLVRFMSAQQGPDWRDTGNLLDAAELDFTKAQKWLRKGRKMNRKT